MNLDPVSTKTAKRISDAFADMRRDLDDESAWQMAVEMVIEKITAEQPDIMRLVFEDQWIREGFYNALSRIPAMQGDTYPCP